MTVADIAVGKRDVERILAVRLDLESRCERRRRKLTPWRRPVEEH
jgi:hypothetical protein